jgi:DNA-binding CsgD family transcriptional regulator/PAS domain-containing protein
MEDESLPAEQGDILPAEVGGIFASEMGDVLDSVAHSRTPMMVLRVPELVIVAASPGAHALLDPLAEPLIGHSLTDFTQSHPSGAMPLLESGRITAFETLQVIRATGQRRRLWISALPDTPSTGLVIAMLMKERAGSRAYSPRADRDASAPVIGSTDARLVVDRVSNEVSASLGYRVDEVVGISFLALIVPEDIADVLTALAQTSKHKEGVALRVGVVSAELVPVTCQLVLLPLPPPPSCAFALLSEDSDQGAADGRTIDDLIASLGRGIRGAMTAYAFEPPLLRSDVDLQHLSSRELEIVTRLVAGDRVASIAKQLFLSEGTIRNHLSSVFGKLGVRNQQELIDLLRPRRRSDDRK